MDDVWEPASPPPPEPSGRPEFLRPRYLVGLGLLAAVVLVAGLVAVLGGDDRVAIDPGTTSAPTPSLTTTPIPLPSTTTSTTTTSTTTTSTTTTSTSTTSTTTTSSTTPPLPAVANAGDDVVVSADVEVRLAAIDLSETDQSVVWRQMAGPDVTLGAGRLLGAEVTFRSPGRPTTLAFEMTVTGRGGDVARDELRVDVLQDAGAAIFVDGVSGDDDGDGSRARPFLSLAQALGAAGGGRDIYLRSSDGVYDTGGLAVAGGTSIFGGYDGEWVRDVDARSRVGALRIEGGGVTILSSLDVVAPGGDGDVEALTAVGSDRLIVELSRIEAGSSSSGQSIGLRVDDADEVLLVESEIRSGDAGDGADGVAPPADVELGAEGLAAVGPVGGAGGGAGGSGGDGGTGPNPGGDGGPSGSGGAGGAPGGDAEPGTGAGGGVGGAGGDGGVGFGGVDPTGAAGSPGSTGEPGLGGPGGGGGGGVVGHDGGGGGGGGGGGAGGAGGGGGAGGHGSVGVLLVDVDRVVVRDSTIEAGAAGDGGDGALGVTGGSGGAGGTGAEGVSTFLDTAGAGAGGGGGGAGGEGGRGGGGAGGASIGLLTAGVGDIEVSGSRVVGGVGGNGGEGGQGGVRGASGTDGDGRTGGPGGVGEASDGARGLEGQVAAGGDSIGWWDDGATRSVSDSTIVSGTPGAPDGRALDLVT